MDPAYEMVGDLKCELTIDGKTRKSHLQKARSIRPRAGLFFELCFAKTKEPEPGGAEGLADVRIINALLESQSSGKSVKISAVNTGAQPSPDQEIHQTRRCEARTSSRGST